MNPIATFKLENGQEIPALAFGSGSKHRIKKWQDEMDADTLDSGLVDVLVNAIDAGFTHLDTAEVYTTQGELSRAIQLSGKSRSELFISDKADSGWPEVNKPCISEGPKDACLKGLEKFGMEYYDQFLLHSPFFREDLISITLEEAWTQMEELYLDGKVKIIGVCNFTIEDFEKIMKIAKIKPMINQIEYHLYLQDQSDDIVNYCRSNGILIEAFAPLTPILESKIGKSEHPVKELVNQLAEKYQVQPSSICLRWIYQNGALPITTTSNKDRMVKAFEVFHFELTDEEMDALTKKGQELKVRTIFNGMFKKYDE